MADVSTIPPFIVFQKPIFRFTTANTTSSTTIPSDDKTIKNNNNKSSDVTGGVKRGNSPTRVARVYIDEVANDVVIFSMESRQVCFYQLQLREGSEEMESKATTSSFSQSKMDVGAALLCHGDNVNENDNPRQQQQQQEEGVSDVEWLRHHPALPADAIALTVRSRGTTGELLPIRYAKRCPTPLYSASVGIDSSGSGSRAYLVALSVDTRSIFFVLCHPQIGTLPLYVAAMFQCAPRNLRFREDFYPIHAFYWAEELRGVHRLPNNNSRKTTHLATSFSTKRKPQRGMSLDGGITLLRRTRYLSIAPSNRRIILCITSISIDVLGVDEERLQHNAEEFSTGDDGNNRGSIQLLRRYPTHTDYWHYCPSARTFLSINRLKPCILKTFEVTDEGLRTLPIVRLDENDLERDSGGNYSGTGGAQDVGCVFSFAAYMEKPAVQYPVVFFVLYRQLFLCSFSRRCRGFVLFRYVPAKNGGGDGAGSFVKHAVLRTEFSLSPQRESVALQVIDNLIVLHALRRGITCVFDIVSSEEQFTVQGGFAPSPLSPPTTTAATRTTPVAAPMLMAALERSRNGRDSVFSTCTNSDSQASFSLDYEMLAPVSWIARPANGLRGGANDGDGNVPVLQPLHGAALMMHPPLPSCGDDCVPMDGDELYSHTFICGTLPMLLDSRNGTVYLVGVNPFAIGAMVPQTSRRIEFYLNRLHCAGAAVQSMLYSMLIRQESLNVVSHTLAVIATHHAREQLLQRLEQSSGGGKKGVPSWVREPLRLGVTAAEAPVSCGYAYIFGSTAALRQFLPAGDAQGPLPREPPWRGWSGVTLRDVLTTCTTGPHVKNDGDPNIISFTDMSIGQFVIQRDVFAPLAEMALTSISSAEGPSEFAAEPIESTTTAMTARNTPVGAETVDAGGTFAGHLFFTRYLFYVVLEYARCVMHTGTTLIDSLQRLLLRLLYKAAPNCGLLHHLLLPGMITDQVPTAMILLQMGVQYRQLGIDMLLRLQEDVLVVQVFLAWKRPLDAARYVFAEELQGKRRSNEKLCTPRILNEILQCAMEVMLEEEKDSEAVSRNRPKTMEFMTVFAMISNILIQQQLTREMLPPDYLLMKTKYMQLLSERLES